MAVFDADFQPDDAVPLYEGSRFHWNGKVGDMTESDKKEHGATTRSLLDESEGCKALLAK